MIISSCWCHLFHVLKNLTFHGTLLFLNILKNMWSTLHSSAEWFMVSASKMVKQPMSHAMLRHHGLNKRSILEELSLWRYISNSRSISGNSVCYSCYLLYHQKILSLPSYVGYSCYLLDDITLSKANNWNHHSVSYLVRSFFFPVKVDAVLELILSFIVLPVRSRTRELLSLSINFSPPY